MGKYDTEHDHVHADTPPCESEAPDTKVSSEHKRTWPRPIIYRRSPRDQAEREQRLTELRQYSEQKGLRWDDLTPAEIEKKVQFGTRAKARNRERATRLTAISSRIVHERLSSYLDKQRLSRHQRKALDSVLGFGDSPDMRASNLAVRIAFATAFVRAMFPLFRRNRHLNFYFLTFIHEGWHCLSSNPVLPLDDIRSRLRNVMQGKGMEWVAVIEIDAVKNYPQGDNGRLLMPHVHMIAWTAEDRKPDEIGEELRLSTRLTSAFGAKTVVVRRIMRRATLAHLCYYLTKPPYQCKTLGAFNPKNGRHSMRPVLKRVPPYLTLAICKMLSSLTVKQLMLVSGHQGKAIRREVWNALDQRRPLSTPSHVQSRWRASSF